MLPPHRRKPPPMRRALIACLPALLAAGPAVAHHMEDGDTPVSWQAGLLSGLAHPVIGLDHLAFLVAVGLATAVAGGAALLPAVFVLAAAAGVGLTLAGLALPMPEALVAASVLVAGLLLARERAAGTGLWAGLLGAAGLAHGQAYGAAVVGAEATPILAYLVGLTLVQGALAVAVAWLAAGWRTRGGAIGPRLAGATLSRLAGATLCGVGLATLAAVLSPAG